VTGLLGHGAVAHLHATAALGGATTRGPKDGIEALLHGATYGITKHAIVATNLAAHAILKRPLAVGAVKNSRGCARGNVAGAMFLRALGGVRRRGHHTLGRGAARAPARPRAHLAIDRARLQVAWLRRRRLVARATIVLVAVRARDGPQLGAGAARARTRAPGARVPERARVRVALLNPR